jgi:hypothetical protein
VSVSRAINLRELAPELQERITGKRSASARRAWERRKKKSVHPRDDNASQFRLLCKASGLPMPVTEFKFHETRKWRWDYAFPEEKIAIEVDGGLFVRGAHVRGARILLTHEKLNAAAVLGWRVVYRVPNNLCTDDTLEMLKNLLSPHP